MLATAVELKWEKPISNGYEPKEYMLEYRVVFQDYENYINDPKAFIDKYRDAEFTDFLFDLLGVLVYLKIAPKFKQGRSK